MQMRFWISVFCWLLSATANAEYSIKDYKAVKAKGESLEWEVFKEYIDGVGVGYMWANESFAADHKIRYFCSPPHLSMNADNYVSIINGVLKEHKLPDDQSIELVLWHGLQDTFPCPP